MNTKIQKTKIQKGLTRLSGHVQLLKFDVWENCGLQYRFHLQPLKRAKKLQACSVHILNLNQSYIIYLAEGVNMKKWTLK